MTAVFHYARQCIALAALGFGLTLAGCQKTTTTTDTPTGTTTTTTYSAASLPAMGASASTMASDAMSGASQALSKAENKLDNGALTAKVKTALLAAAAVKAMQIDVDSKDGVVTLNGTQETSAAIERAVAVATGTDGVASVDNKLTVKAP